MDNKPGKTRPRGAWLLLALALALSGCPFDKTPDPKATPQVTPTR